MTLPMPVDEHANRVAKARSLMAKANVDALIVTDPVTYGYFTGNRVPAWMKARPSIFILPASGEPALITWSGPQMFARLYNKPFPSWVQDKVIYPDVPFTREPRTDWGIHGVLADRGLTKGRLAIEMGRNTWLGIPLNDFTLLREQAPQAEFVDSSEIVWGCRMIKSEWEVACLEHVCVIGQKAWYAVLEEVQVGMTPREVQQRILQRYLEFGADIDSGPPMAMGANGPSGTFQKGDILYLDGGPAFQGYQMDITRRAVFGTPSERQRHEHEEMWDIMFEVIDRMKPGVSMTELFEFSSKRMAQVKGWRDYADHPAKRIGHGIGLESEPPSMSAVDETLLAEGMVLTPEPKLESVDGLVNPEEQVAVTATGCRLLSDDTGGRLIVIE
jgi:Xaa-Pro aminopeptidase